MRLSPQLTVHIHRLQKYRDDCAKHISFKYDPERNRREEEAEIESIRRTFSSTIPASSKDEPIPHRNYLTKSTE